MKPLVIYHVGCNDGICGALVLKLALGDVDIKAAQYGDDPPTDEEVKGREVWIVDFSYPRDVLIHLNELASKLVVLDHHKTAASNCRDLPFATFDLEQSGAMLAYKAVCDSHLVNSISENRNKALRLLCSYVQDRDLWKWELPSSRELSAWMSSFPRDLETWEEVVLSAFEVRPILYLVREGAAVLRQVNRFVELLASKMIEAWYKPDGESPVKVGIVNSPLLQSEVGELLCKETDVAFAVLWWLEDKDFYIYSLRSGSEFDVSEVAKRHGGGGHAKAAGFTSNQPPEVFFTLLK